MSNATGSPHKTLHHIVAVRCPPFDASRATYFEWPNENVCATRGRVAVDCDGDGGGGDAAPAPNRNRNAFRTPSVVTQMQLQLQF